MIVIVWILTETGLEILLLMIALIPIMTVMTWIPVWEVGSLKILTPRAETARTMIVTGGLIARIVIALVRTAAPLLFVIMMAFVKASGVRPVQTARKTIAAVRLIAETVFVT
jgi:hypothetical protein